MATALDSKIRVLLKDYGGNVRRVCSEIPVSPSYVYRIKSEEKSSPVTAPPKALPPPESDYKPKTTAEILNAILEPNTELLAKVRDAAVQELYDRIRGVKSPPISDRYLVKAVEVLLQYERDMLSVLTPSINLFQDNTVNLVNLVNQLEEMPVEKLRALSGQEYPPAVIEGEVNNDSL